MVSHSTDDIKGLGVAGVRGAPGGFAGVGYAGVGGRAGGDGLALDLQFATDKTLTARKGPTPTFTRASSGTFVGSNGLVQTAGNNVARFDHDPVTLASRGLLIEESRTNQSLYSGALVNNTGWVTGDTTLATSGIGPDGNTSYIASEITTTNIHTFVNTGGTGFASATSVVNGTVYTGSIFIKKVTGSVDWIQISLGSAGFGSSQYANFNISNGTVGNSAGLASGTSPRIENYGNGWYRCSISVAAIATTTTLNIVVAFINNTNVTTRVPSYAGSTSNSVLASMCQFEAGSFATSYIPTTTASVVRSADVCSISGAGFTGMWNATEGSLFTSAIFNAPISFGVAQMMADINDGTNANRLRSFRGTTGVMAFFNLSNSVSTVEIIQPNPIQPFTSQRTSAGFKANDYAFYVNNTLIGVDSIGAIAISPTTMNIGEASAGSAFRQYTNGTISSIRYYRKRLPNAKLQALTA